MNNLTIAGNLGKDAEIRHIPDGTPVASFSVADSQGRDKPTIWWRCQLFGKRAESLAPYLTKGAQVTVTGSVTERDWTDKDGMARKSMDVRVNDVALQGSRPQQDAQQQAPQRPAQRPAPSRPASREEFEGMDDDIPF